MNQHEAIGRSTRPRLTAGSAAARANGIIAGLAVMAVIVGSLTYAIAAMSFTPPTWVALSAPGAVDLKGVAFPDATSGYAVGGGGAILRTGDGGATWAALVSETTSTLNAVDFPSSAIGWAVGNGGTVQASVDGTSWSVQSSGVATDLLGVDFADSTHGWAVGRGGTIIATTDGGSTWTTQTASVPEATTLYGVAFSDTRTGWAWGDGGLVARTTDAGSTWTTGTVASEGVSLHAGVFLDGRTGWVGGSGGVVRRTTDGGATWTTQTVDTTATVFGITFMDADHGFLVGGGSGSSPGVIAGTADGGATWNMQTPDAPGVYRGVHFADAVHGLIVGDGGTVLRTVLDSVPTTLAVTSAPGLDAPVGVYARALTSGEVLLGWTESVNATAPVTYRVSRSIGGGDYVSLAIVRSADGPSLVDTSAPAVQAVAYEVSTIDPTGESTASAPATVVTKAPRAPLEVRPARMSCTGCHSAHSARQTEVHPGPDGPCFACHESDIGQRLSGDDPGTRHDLLPSDQTAVGSRIACANCHEPHLSSETTPLVDPDNPSPFGGVRAVTDAFCLRCHDGSLPTSVETTAWAPVPLGVGGATVAGDIAATWAGDVHGAATGTSDPQLRTVMGYTAGETLACTTCHDPHGSTNRWTLLESVPSKDGTRHAGGLLVVPVPGGGADLRLFCAGCHSLASHPAADLTWWPIDCTSCHKHGRGL